MYKVIYNNKVIDVLRYPTYVRFLNFNQVTTTGRTTAQGVAGSDGDTLFGLTPEAVKKRPALKLVTLEEISEQEYDKLKALLDKGTVVSADESELTKAKALKIATLSNQCKAKIIAGFTVELSDGEAQEFRLTMEDQLNLIRLSAQLNDGVTEVFVYHATGQPCKVFTKADMAKVVSAAWMHMTFHTTYFNIAKQYINACTSIEEVQQFNYGMDVSSSTNDSIIKQILKRGIGRV